MTLSQTYSSFVTVLTQSSCNANHYISKTHKVHRIFLRNVSYGLNECCRFAVKMENFSKYKIYLVQPSVDETVLIALADKFGSYLYNLLILN